MFCALRNSWGKGYAELAFLMKEKIGSIPMSFVVRRELLVFSHNPYMGVNHRFLLLDYKAVEK